MSNIIITGATSFIGVHLIEKLIEKDHKIFAVVRPNSKKADLIPKSPKVNLVELDMADYGKLAEAIKEPCDVMYALTWNGTRGSDRADGIMQENNYHKTYESIEEAIKLGCNTIITAGSQAEYGPINGEISEETVPNPNTEYGKWKLKLFEDASRLCKEKGVALKEPRYFSLYGADDFEGTMIKSILNDMVAGRECALTQCIQNWNFLYIDDAIDAIVKMAEVECADGAYNMASTDTRQLKEFVLEMQRISGSDSKLNFGAVAYPTTGMVSFTPIVDKAVNELNWSPSIDFEEGIKKVLAAIR